MAASTIPAVFLEQTRLRPQKSAYGVRENNEWRMTKWVDYVRTVRLAARALIKAGFKPGDKVTILGANHPEWTMFDIAAMCAGGVAAGIYSTSSPAEIRYIVEHSEAEFILVDSLAQWEKVKAVRDRLPRLKHVIFMSCSPVPDDPLAIGWEAFLKLGEAVEDRVVDETVNALKGDQPATFIYTSGTTGPPKAVMLSHENLHWTASNAVGFVGLTDSDRSISYLPMSHIAEQMFTIHAPAASGCAVYYAESLEKLRSNLTEVKPTVLFGVPRVWEKFHEGLQGRMRGATGLRKVLLNWARRVATQANTFNNSGKPLPPLVEIQYAIAKKLVLSKIRSALGLDETRLFISGAAPIGLDVIETFASLDIVIQEVYGQSEGSGPTSFNQTGHVKFGSVGQPIPGDEVKIADDGEVLVRGRNVFLGYYKDPAATAEALANGWLNSGDLGEIDAEGFLHITGRKKEIVITAGGKNITPNNIEGELKKLPLVADAVVIGDRRKFLAALLTLKAEEVQRWSQPRGIDPSAATAHPDMKAELQRGIDAVNAELSRVETIRKFNILPGAFSIDGGELTPTMKLRRKVVAEKYASAIEEMYRADLPE